MDAEFYKTFWIFFFLTFLEESHLETVRSSSGPSSEHEHTSVIPTELPKRSRQSKIVNGSPSTIGQFPFMVGLQAKINLDYFNFFDLFLYPNYTSLGEVSMTVCGAAVYDSNHVITAAHCLENTTADEISLIFSAWRKDDRHTFAFKHFRIIR